MGFIYYLPGRGFPVASTKNIPAECGLANVLDDGPLANAPSMGTGPDGGSGYFFAADKTEARFSTEANEWVEITNGEKTTHWIGWKKDRPPGPADLVRRQPIGGKPIRLADGREWLIPQICMNRGNLPRRMSYRDGEMVMKVPAQYEPIVDESMWWLGFCVEVSQGENKTFTPQKFFAWAVNLLALNYRVGMVEVGVLELLDDHSDTVFHLTKAALGLDEVEIDQAMQATDKKKGIAVPVG